MSVKGQSTNYLSNIQKVTVNQNHIKQQKKAHATLFKKRFQPMYVEQLAFVINRTNWKFTKLYSHYSFEQERFKKKFYTNESKIKAKCKKFSRKGFL